MNLNQQDIVFDDPTEWAVAAFGSLLTLDALLDEPEARETVKEIITKTLNAAPASVGFEATLGLLKAIAGGLPSA